ncbi:MAG: membrane protein insertion efficiency factor YidD, partial [bacterium]
MGAAATGRAAENPNRMIIQKAFGSHFERAHKRFAFGAALVFVSAAFVNNTPAATKNEDRNKTVASTPIGFYQKYISDLRYGHCQFEPSCSQYAEEAVEAHGWFMGAALATDRLIRCNTGAKQHYQRGDSGRLVDEVDGRSMRLAPPRVPEWLLPRPARPPLPQPAAGLSAGITTAQLAEYADFADALADEGDYERAITEYKRVAFLANSSAVDAWSRLRIGRSYYDAGRWAESAAAFLMTADHASTAEIRRTACFMAAASHFNASRYKDSAGCLRRCGSASSVHENSSGEQTGWLATDNTSAAADGPAPDCLATARLRFLGGLTAFAAGEWTASAARFDDLAVVVPGSGQMYSGRVFDGFRHLVFDGLLIYSVYQLFKNEYYAGGYLLAGFTLPFYVGNIVGARRASEQRNATTRAGFVSQCIAEAGDH